MRDFVLFKGCGGLRGLCPAIDVQGNLLFPLNSFCFIVFRFPMPDNIYDQSSSPIVILVEISDRGFVCRIQFYPCRQVA